MIINSYTKYYALFNKRAFFTQIERFAVQIDHLGEKMLKIKIIKRYLVGL